MWLQTLWALASVSKSTVYARQDAAASILNSAKRHEAGEAAQRLFHQFAEVADQFIRLCNHPGPDKRRACLSVNPTPSCGSGHSWRGHDTLLFEF